nr:MAG TPA_asm: hypothetical protein [Caudoviricetes sp.]
MQLKAGNRPQRIPGIKKSKKAAFRCGLFYVSTVCMSGCLRLNLCQSRRASPPGQRHRYAAAPFG